MASETELERLYTDVRDAHLQPLWIDTPTYVPRHPAPEVEAAHWPAQKIFPLLRQAGKCIPSHVADRRVLICTNPGLQPFSGTTQTIYACFQLLMPGESASEHRHTQNAVRFVLSGEGAYTTVNGRKIYMHRGDFLVTPAWAWHGHNNESGTEMIWVDGLDSLLIKLFNATFFELPTGDHPFDTSNTQPQLLYDWATTRRQLDTERRNGHLDPSNGFRIRYLDPQTNSDPLPTIAAFLSYLPVDFNGTPYRSSDSVVFVVVSGKGCTVLENTTIEWSENDIFTIPTWQQYQHVCSGDAVLFSFSDRAAQERLGCWRDDRGDSNSNDISSR
jgi:gentisate 1,2-dioxygenase